MAHNSNRVTLYLLDLFKKTELSLDIRSGKRLIGYNEALKKI